MTPVKWEEGIPRYCTISKTQIARRPELLGDLLNRMSRLGYFHISQAKYNDDIICIEKYEEKPSIEL